MMPTMPRVMLPGIVVSRAVTPQPSVCARCVFAHGDEGMVKPVLADALGKRIGRRMKSLTGDKAPRTQLFRPMFVTWLGEQRPTMPERETLANYMQHSVERQLLNYDKRLRPGDVPSPKRRRTLLPAETGDL